MTVRGLADCPIPANASQIDMFAALAPKDDDEDS
jgi:hypothetical protein